MSLPHRQDGVALLTAMLIVALATVAAASITRDQFLNVRRVENLLTADQAYLHALGVENWGRGMLAKDLGPGADPSVAVDGLNEAWHVPLPQTEVEGGFVRGSIEDLQGRFNLNNLQISPNDTVPGADAQAQLLYLQRLLTRLELDPALAQKIADWLDPDIDARYPSGAEDLVYMRANPPYRAGNVPMANVSELLLVDGITAEIYRRLEPFVIALPRATPINVNTAKREVLAALTDDIDEGRLDAALAAREQQAFASPEAFMTAAGLRQPDASDENAPSADSPPDNPPPVQPAADETLSSLVGVGSSFFAIHAESRVGQMHVRLTSTLFRDPTSGPQIIERHRLPY